MEEKLITDFFNEENSHWWHINKRSLIKESIGKKKAAVLVLGIGGGLLCKELINSGHNVNGIDIFYPSCRFASEQFKIKTIVADLEAGIPCESNRFDVIILADVLEHIAFESGLLGEMRRCLKAGGEAIITVPAYEHMWSYWDERLSHKRRYELKSLRQKITAAGFSIKKISYFNSLLYPAVFLFRKIASLSGRNYRKSGSDFKTSSSKWLTGIALKYYVLERAFLKHFNLPFGLSILAVCSKQ
ncbi:MAG: class I SAM-dependent methyltransferase [Candidatus Omnitrophica bacterium]|nr:class I SAM-dependent methyltransferase [Candidatus Omnitrophota bacterium]